MGILFIFLLYLAFIRLLFKKNRLTFDQQRVNLFKEYVYQKMSGGEPSPEWKAERIKKAIKPDETENLGRRNSTFNMIDQTEGKSKNRKYHSFTKEVPSESLDNETTPHLNSKGKLGILKEDIHEGGIEEDPTVRPEKKASQQKDNFFATQSDNN
jgi:hypothetical protein